MAHRYPTVTPEQKSRLNSCLLDWFDQYGRDFPWRRTSDPYQVLMAEMMLQRTRATQVEPVWSAFITRWPSLDEARCASGAELAEALAPLGLNWRIENIVRLIRSLPDLETPDRLRGAQGVGHYVESAVRCFAFGERVAIVDANVVRFYGRVFGFPVNDSTRRDRAFHAFAESLLPDARWKEYNWALLDFRGRPSEIGGPFRDKK